MKALAQLLIVAGFCVAAIGAAGFDKKLEPEAIPLFAGGMIALFIGAFLAKSTAKTAVTETQSGDLAIRSQVEGIRDIVIELDEQKANLSSEVLCERIDNLLRNEYFDLASRNDEIAAQLGFNDYAKVWDGIAIGERLLARVWSIATDGHHEEALESLPQARQNLERAAEAAAAVGASN